MRLTSFRSPSAVPLILLLLATAAALAGNWPQWRGPHRDGVASLDHQGPWPQKLTLQWKVEAGEGHSAPIVSGDRIFLLAREGESEVVSSLALETGKTIWRQSYAAPYEMNSAARGHGKGPKSTPVLDGGRLYTFGISGIRQAALAQGFFEAVRGNLAGLRHGDVADRRGRPCDRARRRIAGRCAHRV